MRGIRITSKFLLEWFKERYPSIEFIQNGREKLRQSIETILTGEDLSTKQNAALAMWETLLYDALTYLGSDTGFETMKNYIKKFREYELVLYGVHRQYRDHFFHQLWVYLLGEYLLIEQGLINHTSLLTIDIPTTEAAWAIVSLVHDVGYPLEKVAELNQAVTDMLGELKNVEVTEFAVKFKAGKRLLTQHLVDILSTSLEPIETIVKKGIDTLRLSSTKQLLEDKAPKKSPPSVSQHLDRSIFSLPKVYYLAQYQKSLKTKLLDAFDNYDHGLISATILFESMEQFLSVDVPTFYEIICSLEPVQVLRVNILDAIAFHNLNLVHPIGLNLTMFLILIDELQEFERPSRIGESILLQDSSELSSLYLKKATLEEYEAVQRIRLHSVIRFKGIAAFDPKKVIRSKTAHLSSILQTPKGLLLTSKEYFRNELEMCLDFYVNREKYTFFYCPECGQVETNYDKDKIVSIERRFCNHFRTKV